MHQSKEPHFQVNFRFTANLLGWLDERSRKNRRSRNAEIMVILDNLKKAEEDKQQCNTVK